MELRNYIKSRIAYAQYRVGSTWHRAEISGVSALSDGTVRVKIPIFANGGTVNRVAVYNEDGEQWTYRDCKIVTSSDETGILFWFDFTVSDVSVGDGTIITIETSVIVHHLRIPATGWQLENEENDYPYRRDVFMTDALESHSPSIALDKESLTIAGNAGLCPTAQALDGFLRFWSREIPAGDMKGTVTLYPCGQSSASGSTGGASIPIATDTIPGAVMIKPGSGLTVSEDGDLALDAATMDDLFDQTQREGG